MKGPLIYYESLTCCVCNQNHENIKGIEYQGYWFCSKKCYDWEIKIMKQNDQQAQKSTEESTENFICCDPNAPIVPCHYCSKNVNTCEREISVNDDYRCPKHPNGLEYQGYWFCDAKCKTRYKNSLCHPKSM